MGQPRAPGRAPLEPNWDQINTMNDNFCCVGLKNLISDAGKRGLAVLADKVAKRDVLCLQSRGVAFDDLPKIQAVVVDYKINLATDGVISFCPHCGRRLEDLINASRPFYEELAAKHEKFLARSIPPTSPPKE